MYVHRNGDVSRDYGAQADWWGGLNMHECSRRYTMQNELLSEQGGKKIKHTAKKMLLCFDVLSEVLPPRGSTLLGIRTGLNVNDETGVELGFCDLWGRVSVNHCLHPGGGIMEQFRVRRALRYV